MRGKYEVVHDILDALLDEPLPKNRLNARANINNNVVKQLRLEEKGLIKITKKGKTHLCVITPKGVQFLHVFKEARHLLEDGITVHVNEVLGDM